jgi:hypothetical protein
MFDHFLTFVLQIVIAIDVLGAIAYFVLGALKGRSRKTSDPVVLELAPPRPSLWQRLFCRPRPALATEGDLTRLRRVLYSFQEGLA